jgi:hypothetical protein
LRAKAKSRPNPADLEFFEACAYLRVQDKTGSIVPLQPNRVQRHLITHLTGRDLVLKARQVGISTILQAWFFWHQLRGGVRTSTLCHEDDLTSTLRRMVDLMFDEYPPRHRPARKYANAKLTTYEGINSEGSIATVGGLAGSKKGRGGSVNFVHGSEVAFWPDAQGVMAAAMQAGSPQIVLESTPNGMTGWFYERCMEALDGRGIWRLHFFPWWWDGEYQRPLEPGQALDYEPDEAALVEAHTLTPEQINWRRYKQAELGRQFLQEYPEDPYSCFLASGESFFGDVSHAFTAPLDAAPEDGHRYVMGLDFGQTTDYTVGIVGDLMTQRMVDMLRVRRQPWHDMRAQIAAMARMWHNATVIAEHNSIGGPNIEALRADGVNVVSFKTTSASKPPLMQGLRHGLHEGGLQIQPRDVIRHELRAFVSTQLPSGAWQYAAQDGAHDDTIIALALMWRGMNQPVTQHATKIQRWFT